MALFSPIPRELRDEIAGYAAEYRAVLLDDGERIDRYRKYRDEMSASRDTQIGRAVGREGDYWGQSGPKTRTARHNVSVPLGLATTVKHAYRTAGRLPDVIVDRRAETPEERYRSDTMERIVWGIIRASDGEQQFATGSWDASQVGAQCYDLYWSVAAQMPLFRAIDPGSIVVSKGVNDPHHFQRIFRFWTASKASILNDYRNAQFRGEPIALSQLGRGRQDLGREILTIVQMTDRQHSLRFVLEGEVPLWEEHHGLSFAPYVVIPNLGPYRDVWGWADYEFYRGVAAYIPAHFSREADIIRSVANGAMKTKGARVSAAKVVEVMREGGVVPVGKDGDVEPIDVPQVPAFAEAHGGRAMELFKMLSFAPDAAWGIGGAASASDRGLQLLPQQEVTALKQINLAGGLSRLFSYAFQMIEQKQASRATYRGAIPTAGGRRRKPFAVTLESPTTQTPTTTFTNPAFDPDNPAAGDEIVDVPTTARELFDGDHTVRFLWQAHIDRTDPAFIQGELNKFIQGAQSLYTTLENLGVQAPEDECRLIEDEAKRFPWLRQGMIALITAQLRQNAQGQGGGGSQMDPGEALTASLSMLGSKDGNALDADATARSLPGSVGQLFGGA